ncbi:AurF N-oxygenase family protein [Nocardioides sp.]|uniref:AurF N-oxygenase family protein n=1 Tax=Nocardioides sp. TaxID=35761 RepID=UPI0039E338A0
MTVTSERPDYVSQGRQGYYDTLRTLSVASVDHHFDAFKDIDWDDPDFVVDRNDERWILGPEDNLGAHPWYRTLPRDRQIEVGIYRWALICKVGLQFEQLLISGIMFDNLKRRNGNPEFRYSTHEATEECHHTQMFQEFVNRTGTDVAGAPTWFRRLIPLVAMLGYWAPAGFWMGVLAGEEPIDHLQKRLLRANGNLHPMLRRIISIHVAEEARHIGFAHQYLTQHTPHLSGRQRALLGLATPLVMRLLCDVIMRPSAEAIEAMGIPEEVAREIWWDNPEAGKFLRDLFADVRMLFDDLGLRGPVARRLWRAMGIDGRPARYRSEPAAAAH